MQDPELIYKIATASGFAGGQSDGAFTGVPIDTQDGFIHLSTAGQLAETLRLHFRGQSDLVLLAVRTADLGADLRWEPSRGGALFPHFYGPLPLSAVAWRAAIAVADDGSCALPDGVR